MAKGGIATAGILKDAKSVRSRGEIQYSYWPGLL